MKKVYKSTWDFASDEQSDQRKVGAKEQFIRYLENLAVNGHPTELGADPAKITKGHNKNLHKTLVIPSVTAAASAADGTKPAGMRKGCQRKTQQ